jgi:hypothetical protein
MPRRTEHRTTSSKNQKSRREKEAKAQHRTLKGCWNNKQPQLMAASGQQKIRHHHGQSKVPPSSQDAEDQLSPQQIIDHRLKELERERRAGPGVAVKKPSAVRESVKSTQIIVDQQQKERERQMRMESGGATMTGIDYDCSDEGADCKPATRAKQEGKTDMSKNKATHTRRTRRSTKLRESLPGAVRHQGPDFDPTKHNDDAFDDDVEVKKPLHRTTTRPAATAASQQSSTVEDRDTADDLAVCETQRPPEQSTRPVQNDLVKNDSLVVASMVDDAETIFYAEDAVVDRSRRRMTIAIVLVVAACVLAIVLAVLLIDTSEEETCSFEEEACCTVDFDDFSSPPKAVAYICYCLNTTEGLYENLNEQQLMIYNGMKARLIGPPNMNMNMTQGFSDDIDPSGCHPLNQALLFAAQFEQLGISLEHFGRAPQSLVNQLLALLTIYTTMDGVSWNQDTNWWETGAICGWFGVGCVFVETISSLRLPENGLKGSIPTEIGNLASLRALDLHGNLEMTGTLPSEIVSMTSLDSLDISRSPMGGEVPPILGDLTTLNRLDLSSCEFVGTIPSELFRLSSIRFMSLSNNYLHGPLPTEMGGFRRMDLLRLNRNGFTGTLPSEMEMLTQLGLLHIGQNNFSGTIPDFLGRMKNLMLMDLFDSGLSGPIPESFCGQGDQSNNATMVGGPTIPDGQTPRQQRVPRRVVVNCSEIEFCSCCGATGRDQVAIVCGDLLPEQALQLDGV